MNVLNGGDKSFEGEAILPHSFAPSLFSRPGRTKIQKPHLQSKEMRLVFFSQKPLIMVIMAPGGF